MGTISPHQTSNTQLHFQLPAHKSTCLYSVYSNITSPPALTMLFSKATLITALLVAGISAAPRPVNPLVCSHLYHSQPHS